MAQLNSLPSNALPTSAGFSENLSESLTVTLVFSIQLDESYTCEFIWDGSNAAPDAADKSTLTAVALADVVGKFSASVMQPVLTVLVTRSGTDTPLGYDAVMLLLVTVLKQGTYPPLPCSG